MTLIPIGVGYYTESSTSINHPHPSHNYKKKTVTQDIHTNEPYRVIQQGCGVRVDINLHWYHPLLALQSYSPPNMDLLHGLPTINARNYQTIGNIGFPL